MRISSNSAGLRASTKIRQWHKAVQQAQAAAIGAVKAGASCGEVDAAARAVLTVHHLDQYFVHSTGHGLGLEVHEDPRIAKGVNRTLEPGNVVTIEPGVYFIAALLQDRELRRKHKGSVDFAKAETFLDFGGIRIEDDIVITGGAPLNLTTVPKEIADVEAACER